MMMKAVILFMLIGSAVFAADVPREFLSRDLDAAIDRGLWFLHKQQKDDGSFDAAGPPNATTGLGVMAFLASGHVPDMGKYGLTVRNAVDYLLEQKPADGYFGVDGSGMYGHCVVAIALAEVCGMETDAAQQAAVRSALEKALEVIFAAQDVKKDAKSAGGWRNNPTSQESELGATAWCLMAMRACADAGLEVPRARVDRGMQYILRCYNKDQNGFARSPGQDAAAPATAAALTQLFLNGRADRPEVSPSIRFLMEKPVKEGAAQYHSALYQTTLAAFEAGDQPGRPAWSVLWKNAQEQLLSSQRREDGGFPPRRDDPAGEGRAGRFYSTAMSVLTLSTPLRLLPANQK